MRCMASSRSPAVQIAIAPAAAKASTLTKARSEPGVRNARRDAGGDRDAGGGGCERIPRHAHGGGRARDACARGGEGRAGSLPDCRRRRRGPSCSTKQRSAMSSTMSRSWVAVTTVRPRPRHSDQEIDDPARAFRVKPGGRLVEEKHFRLEDQYGGKRHPLLLTAGETMRRAVLEMRDRKFRKHRGDAPADRLLRPAELQRAEGELVEDGRD